MTVPWTAVAVVALLFGVPALLRAPGLALRFLAVRGVSAPTKTARGVALRVHVHGGPEDLLPGMSRRRPNRTRGDLVASAERVLLVCNRGVIFDHRLGAPGFTAVRCTGPERLAIEGELPMPRGEPGRYRLELTLPDAEGWAAALAPWVRGA